MEKQAKLQEVQPFSSYRCVSFFQDDDLTPLSVASVPRVVEQQQRTFSDVTPYARIPSRSSPKRGPSVPVIDLEEDENTTTTLANCHFKSTDSFMPSKCHRASTLLNSKAGVDIEKQNLGKEEMSSEQVTKRMRLQNRVIRRVKKQIKGMETGHLTSRHSELQTIDLQSDAMEERMSADEGYRRKLRNRIGGTSQQQNQSDSEMPKLLRQALKLMKNKGSWSQLEEQEAVRRLKVSNYRFECSTIASSLARLAKETAKTAIFLGEKAEVPLEPSVPRNTQAYQRMVHDLRQQFRKRTLIILD